MCYVVRNRLVRVENATKAPVVKGNLPKGSDDEQSGGESIGDDCDDTAAPSAGARRGRRRATQYDFVGDPNIGEQQVDVVLLYCFGSSSVQNLSDGVLL